MNPGAPSEKHSGGEHAGEDEYSGEKSVVPEDPSAADYELLPCILRSVAALGVVLGVAGMLAVPFGLLRFHQGTLTGDYRVHLFDWPLVGTSIQGLWMFVASATGAGLAFVLAAGATGALRLKSWSGIVLGLWAIGSVLFGAAGAFFYLQWLLPPTRDQLAEVRGVVDSMANLDAWIVGTALAVAMLILLSRRRLRAVLARDGRIGE